MYLSGSAELKATADRLIMQLGIAKEAGDQATAANLSKQISTYRTQLAKALNDERLFLQQQGILGSSGETILGIPKLVVFLGLAGIAVTVGVMAFLRRRRGA